MCFSLLLWLPASGAIGSTDLTPLLNAPGTDVTLSGGTVYTISEYGLTVNKTIWCNGATIQSSGGPIRASASGITFTVDHCVIQGTGWALLGALNGSTLVVRNNTQLTGNGQNSALYVSGSELDMTGGSITQAMWGVNMVNSDAFLHGISITNTPFAVQNVAGAVTLDSNSQLQNLNANNPGTGLSIIASSSYPTRGASAAISNTTFTGFSNAVDIQPTAAQGLPAGTVEITSSTFNTPFGSALSAVDANNVRFIASHVNGAKTDGIYFANSTGLIDQAQVLNSANSGVTFWGCPNGATIRNSLVSGSVHQGIAIVADSANNRVSHNVQVLDNTLRNNTIANVLVDGVSDALIEGNTLTGVPSPNFSVRLHTTSSAKLIGNLDFGSYAGLELQNGSSVNGALSIFNGHTSYGVLDYLNSTATFTHSAFQGNSDYSIFVNSGAQVTPQFSFFGAGGQKALYNNAGNTVTATGNYWGDASGPHLASGGGGTGATIDWNTANGSKLTYSPFLTTQTLDVQVNNTFNLSAGTTTSWQPGMNLSFSLTGAPGITTVSSGLVGALRLRDASTLAAPAPPASTFLDGIFSVWAQYDLLSRAQSGSLRVATSGSGQSARLSRLLANGCWLPLTTTWDSVAAQIVYSPSDPITLNGVFAVGAVPAAEVTNAQQLITSFYWNVLGRAPEAGAVDSWYQGYFAYSVSLGVDVRFVPREMGRLFFASAEYAARNRTDAQFITDNYEAFLQRAPSQSELDAWLSGSWTRPQAVSTFAESAEFASYIQGLFPCFGGIPTRNFVTTMYIGLLDRLADSGGLLYFEDVFDAAYDTGGVAGARQQAVNMGINVLASAEYQSTNPTNETTVTRLYRGYLGRYPSANEISYWAGLLNAHTMTTSDVINAFAISPEFTSRLNTFFGQA